MGGIDRRFCSKANKYNGFQLVREIRAFGLDVFTDLHSRTQQSKIYPNKHELGNCPATLPVAEFFGDPPGCPTTCAALCVAFTQVIQAF